MKYTVHHERNKKGRDFFVGDIHGCISQLMRLLKHVGFDEEIDRLFSTGDLCDRGEDSLEALRLIRKPWFFSVEANHENMLLYTIQEPSFAPLFYRNGGFWVADLLEKPTEDFIELIAELQQVPYIRTVETEHGDIVLLHAELPPRWPVSLSDLKDHDFVMNNLIEKDQLGTRDGPNLLWGRSKFGQFVFDTLPPRDKLLRTIAYHRACKTIRDDEEMAFAIISGHSVLKNPLWMLGQLNIDTGAFYQQRDGRHGMTIFDVSAMKFYKTTPFSVEEVFPDVVTKNDIENIGV